MEDSDSGVNSILGGEVKAHKLEPWNSVRVTLSIPREAALRLRQLAGEGSQQLRALGILGVQLDGDQGVLVRVAPRTPGAQDTGAIHVNQDGGSTERQSADLSFNFLPSSGGGPGAPPAAPAAAATATAATPAAASPSSANMQVQFKSPNVVCPPDSVVPKVGPVSAATAPASAAPPGKPFAGPFPFASMNQAIQSSRDPPPFTQLPPPYPGKHPPVARSSPLLVNLLQNDGSGKDHHQQQQQQQHAAKVAASVNRAIRTPPVPVQVPKAAQVLGNAVSAAPKANNPIPAQANVLVNNSVSPSALTTNTSINRQNSTVSTSTITGVAQPQPPPPQYHRAQPANAVPIQQKPLTLPNVTLNGAVNPGVHPQQPPGLTQPTKLSAALSMGSAIYNHPQTQALVKPALLNAHPHPQIKPPVEPPKPPLPSPPPYSVAVSRNWDTLVHSSPLMDLPPTLADLKPDDLDEILPSLEKELARSPLPELGADLIESHSVLGLVEDKRKFLINPTTGEMELQGSDESEAEAEVRDVFTGLISPAALSDEDTSSTIRPDTTTDQSDSESRSETGKHQRMKVKGRERMRDSPSLKHNEKIKLTLKLEKSEPVNPAYKVDVSFINTQPKKASASGLVQNEELRVPPLHISLRGRNSVVIKNKNKGEGKVKARKNLDHIKIKLDDEEDIKKLGLDKKFKKMKTQESKDSQEKNHFKEKQKERRGSDSELVRSGKKYLENGLISEERKRRMSQSEVEEHLPVLGSTNVGTIASLPQKRKEKVKVKDGFKGKELGRSKLLKLEKGVKVQQVQVQQQQHVVLPTSGEIDMEAKFKQGLLEGSEEKGVARPPHRTEIVGMLGENGRERMEGVEVKVEQVGLKEKSPEPDKCNTPDRKSTEINEGKAVVAGGRSPNSASGGQGEDSGIESMDALSEKSPNQASQSPHADLPPKTQVPDMLDIEAQLAKMEGLNGEADQSTPEEAKPPAAEDVNENKHCRDQTAKCCELTCALQDIKKEPDVKDIPNLEQAEVKKEGELEPSPVRVMPALYTYSNPEKRSGSESPSISDEDSNSCSTSSTTVPNSKSKSLLEQLLIEIPNDHQAIPSSPSPATRSSVRTRALSKLNSPELNSPVAKQRAPPAAKRKRNESDSSNHSVENLRSKKVRACAEDGVKVACGDKGIVKKGAKVQMLEESSDSDEPLIEKMRKNPSQAGVGGGGGGNGVGKQKVKAAGNTATNNNKNVVGTRRSVRSNMPAQNTRSKGDTKAPEADALRRKTRSAVSEVESKRKKEVK